MIVIVAFVLYRRSAGDAASHAADRAPAAAAASPSAPSAGAAKPRPPEHVTRFANPAERQAVADRIAASRAERTRQAPPRPPSLPAESGAPGDGDSHDLERAAPKLKVALAEAIPFLAECYKTAPVKQRRPAVLLTLTGAPDVGTLIAADELTDPDGKPLDADLAGCLRTTLGSLELPALDATGDLHLKYSFVIDDD
jgi:hypothetical protein